MSEFISSIWQEMQAKINSGLTLGVNVKVVQALKIERYDLRQLIADLDIQGTGGFEMPLIVFRYFPAEAVDWGMQNEAYSQRIEIYFMDRSDNEIYTSITTGATNASQTVASTSKMFVGQILTFETTKQVATIKTIDSPTGLTFEAALTTVTNEKVSSELITDVGVRIQQIKDLFLPGTTFTNFQILEQGSLDLTDMNPVNSALMEKNVQMLAGAFSLNILYGNTY